MLKHDFLRNNEYDSLRRDTWQSDVPFAAVPSLPAKNYQRMDAPFIGTSIVNTKGELLRTKLTRPKYTPPAKPCPSLFEKE